MKKSPTSISRADYRQFKDNHFISQLQMIREYFENNMASRLLCSVAAGIRISIICYLVGMFFDSEDIQVVRRDYCYVTGELVQFLSADPEQWPKNQNRQLTFKFQPHEHIK
jgi:hypothetical protein